MLQRYLCTFNRKEENWGRRWRTGVGKRGEKKVMKWCWTIGLAFVYLGVIFFSFQAAFLKLTDSPMSSFTVQECTNIRMIYLLVLIPLNRTISNIKHSQATALFSAASIFLFMGNLTAVICLSVSESIITQSVNFNHMPPIFHLSFSPFSGFFPVCAAFFSSLFYLPSLPWVSLQRGSKVKET